jgi:apolipoprotein N-acyltransferase
VSPVWRWRLAPTLSALLFGLAFQPVSIVPLAFVALIPLILYLTRPDRLRARLIAVAAGGMVFHATGFFWIRHVTVTGMILLAAYATLYWMAFSLVAAAWRGTSGTSPAWPFRVAAAWTLLEHIRGTALSGIPWLLGGHAMAGFSPLAQTADLAGVAGVTFLVVLVNAALAQSWIRDGGVVSSAVASRLPRFAAAALILTACGYSSWRMGDVDAGTRTGPGAPDVLLVQGNIEQSVKKAGLHGSRIHETYARLTREACGRDGLPDVVIWPETMHPAVSAERLAPSALDPLGFSRRVVATRALLGVLVYTPDGAGGAREEWNSALSLDPEGRVVGRYDKVHLVPVGEYFPFREWGIWETLIKRFTALPRVPGLEAGTSLDPVPCGPWRVGTLVCYESAFASVARKQAARGAQFFANLSNEAWYRDSAEMDQMLAMCRFRCIEARTGMARATNSGISAILDPCGRVVADIRDESGRRKEVAGTLRGRVPIGPCRSLYLAAGEWLVWLSALALVADRAVIAIRRRRAAAPGSA